MSQEQLKIIAVKGQGTEKITATLAIVNLAVTAQGESAVEVQREVANRSSTVFNLLTENNVEQLKTTGINPQHYANYQQTGKRYSSNNTINFQVAIDEVGSLIKQVVRAGATRINSVNFTATDETITQAKQVALKKATIDAKIQAEAVLSS